MTDFRPGDRVKCIKLGQYFEPGDIYVVSWAGEGYIKLAAHPTTRFNTSMKFSANRFVLAPASAAQPLLEEIVAEKIVALNNSRPWLPTKEEIIAILKAPYEGGGGGGEGT